MATDPARLSQLQALYQQAQQAQDRAWRVSLAAMLLLLGSSVPMALALEQPGWSDWLWPTAAVQAALLVGMFAGLIWGDRQEQRAYHALPPGKRPGQEGMAELLAAVRQLEGDSARAQKQVATARGELEATSASLKQNGARLP